MNTVADQGKSRRRTIQSSDVINMIEYLNILAQKIDLILQRDYELKGKLLIEEVQIVHPIRKRGDQDIVLTCIKIKWDPTEKDENEEDYPILHLIHGMDYFGRRMIEIIIGDIESIIKQGKKPKSVFVEADDRVIARIVLDY